MRPSWTDVRIDGMDANDPVFGYSPAGASGLFLGLDEFTEVRVLTQTFDAAYGRNGGGVIDAVTKSGANHFHGSLFELYRDAALDSKNYFDLTNAPIPPFVRNQFGAGVGGPLAHDRTFFYADYEGFREVEASTAIATVPDALAHQGLLPSATNPGSCSNATPNGCVVIAIDPRVPQFLALFPPSNGVDNGDGTAGVAWYFLLKPARVREHLEICVDSSQGPHQQFSAVDHERQRRGRIHPSVQLRCVFVGVTEEHPSRFLLAPPDDQVGRP
jgi:hypothetical protein